MVSITYNADRLANLFLSTSRASPRLKDAQIHHDDYPKLYRDLILAVRRMYQDCRLVHADLSEYNILYHHDKLYIIDVSQSVEHDHPHAFDFLRKDISNIEDYFGRQGVKLLGLRRAFEFIIKEKPAELEIGVVDDMLFDRLIHEVDESNLNQTENEKQESQSHEDSVFLKSYIPRNLNDIYDPERDVDLVTSGQAKQLIYSDSIGLVQPVTGAKKTEDKPDKYHSQSILVASTTQPAESTVDSENELTDSGEGSGSEHRDVDTEGDGDEFKKRIPRGHRHEDRDVKKERKKAVKEEAREKRKHKMKKTDKKKMMKSKH